MFAFDATFLSPASASVRARAGAKERGRDNFSVAHFGLFFVLFFFSFQGERLETGGDSQPELKLKAANLLLQLEMPLGAEAVNLVNFTAA